MIWFSYADDSTEETSFRSCDRCGKQYLERDITDICLPNMHTDHKWLCKKCYEEFKKSLFDFEVYFKADPSDNFNKITGLQRRLRTVDHDFDDILELLDYVVKIDEAAKVGEETYMTEESAEMIVELEEFIKKLCKIERLRKDLEENSVNYTKAKEEGIDVLTTVLVYLRRHGANLDEVLGGVQAKLKRTVERFKKDGAV